MIIDQRFGPLLNFKALASTKSAVVNLRWTVPWADDPKYCMNLFIMIKHAALSYGYEQCEVVKEGKKCSYQAVSGERCTYIFIDSQ